MSTNNSELDSKIFIARWTDRFLAWLVDFIIVSSVLGLLFSFVFDTAFDSDPLFLAVICILECAIFFGYWVILEYKTGQSIGKKIFNLKLVEITGKQPTLKMVLLGSFGKAFLLPVDFILGLLLTNEKRQRIFNKLGDTIVIKLKKSQDSSDVKYVKE